MISAPDPTTGNLPIMIAAFAPIILVVASVNVAVLMIQAKVLGIKALDIYIKKKQYESSQNYIKPQECIAIDDKGEIKWIYQLLY